MPGGREWIDRLEVAGQDGDVAGADRVCPVRGSRIGGPLQRDRAGREPRAKSHEQDVVALLDPAGADGLRQGERHRGGEVLP